MVACINLRGGLSPETQSFPTADLTAWNKGPEDYNAKHGGDYKRAQATYIACASASLSIASIHTRNLGPQCWLLLLLHPN